LVALEPEQGFHLHTEQSLACLLGYEDDWLATIPEAAIEPFAGTGNPFSRGPLWPDENVVDVGGGAGIDSLIPGHTVAPDGDVVGVDIAPAMIDSPIAPRSSPALKTPSSAWHMTRP
jgi:arsenite methyltransferase